MDFWKSRAGREYEREDERDGAPEPTFREKLTEFVKDEAKDEAISSVVEYLTDGWITYDGGDDEDEEPQRKKQPEGGTFEERLQRSLAKLQAEAAAPMVEAQPAPEAPIMPAPVAPPPVPVSAAPAPRPALRPPLRGPGGFGRKGL